MIPLLSLPQLRFAVDGRFLLRLCCLFAVSTVDNHGILVVTASQVPLNGSFCSMRQTKGPISTHVGRYVNSNYGYSFSVPEGFKAISDPPPSPQHGVLIRLGRQSSIWVGASYNADDYSTASEAADDALQMITKNGSVILSFDKEEIKLDGLPASRLVVRHKGKSSKETFVQDTIVCLRKEKNKDVIVYEIDLSTTEASYSRDRGILDSILNSWKTEPLP